MKTIRMKEANKPVRESRYSMYIRPLYIGTYVRSGSRGICHDTAGGYTRRAGSVVTESRRFQFRGLRGAASADQPAFASPTTGGGWLRCWPTHPVPAPCGCLASSSNAKLSPSSVQILLAASIYTSKPSPREYIASLVIARAAITAAPNLFTTQRVRSRAPRHDA